MPHYTYLTTDLETYQFYAGVRSCECAPEHDPYLGSGNWIKSAIKKHGKERFFKRVIAEYPTREDAMDAERALITQSYLLLPGCKNQATGGGSGSAKGSRQKSDEWKANIAKALKGRPLSDECKRKIAAALKGRPMSEAARAKLSKMKAGMPSPLKGTTKTTPSSLKGQPWPAARRAAQEAKNATVSK